MGLLGSASSKSRYSGAQGRQACVFGLPTRLGKPYMTAWRASTGDGEIRLDMLFVGPVAATPNRVIILE